MLRRPPRSQRTAPLLPYPPRFRSWLAPGGWLVTGDEANVERVRLRCADAAGDLGLMVDITHARATYELSGAGARSVLAAHCPLDLGDEAMPIGAAKRTTFSETGLDRKRVVQGKSMDDRVDLGGRRRNKKKKA